MTYKEIVFVFGSNLSGIHGAGAARHAFEEWGAELGVGHGRTGQSYALPTKDYEIKTLSYNEVSEYVALFFDYADDNPDTLFLLTPVGTGLAGLDKRVIWSYLKRHRIPSNVALTSTWVVD